MLWSLLSWIIVGFIVGLIARAIVPGRQSLGFLLTTVLGIVGAFVGGLIASAIWTPATDPANPDVANMWQGWIFSIIGAVIVLWGYVALAGRRDTALPGSSV